MCSSWYIFIIILHYRATRTDFVNRNLIKLCWSIFTSWNHFSSKSRNLLHNCNIRPTTISLPTFFYSGNSLFMLILKFILSPHHCTGSLSLSCSFLWLFSISSKSLLRTVLFIFLSISKNVAFDTKLYYQVL